MKAVEKFPEKLPTDKEATKQICRCPIQATRAGVACRCCWIALRERNRGVTIAPSDAAVSAAVSASASSFTSASASLQGAYAFKLRGEPVSKCFLLQTHRKQV
eukprot:564847-Rhodomonas_salina.1